MLLPKLEAAIGKLEANLAAPDAFSRNAAQYEFDARRLADTRTQKDEAELEWLDIEARREALQRETGT